MIFVDTSFWLALWSKQDPDHERVLPLMEQLEGQRLPDVLITSNHVVFETLTLAKVRAGHTPAVGLGRLLYGGHTTRIHQATAQEERAAFELLTRHWDQGYSAVDCLSFVLMERLGIHEAFTLDRHFTHRFVAKPGPFR